jgi:hypothetical protein
MRAIERAYNWVQGLSDEQKSEMQKDFNAARLAIIEAFKDPAITLAQVEMLFKADSGKVKKESLMAELDEKRKELIKIQAEIQELTQKLDVVEMADNKPVNERELLQQVREKQIANMVAEGIKRAELQNAIKAKVSEVANVSDADITAILDDSPKAKKRKKN